MNHSNLSKLSRFQLVDVRGRVDGFIQRCFLTAFGGKSMANEISADHPQVVIQRRIGIRIGCRTESRQEEGRYTPFRLQVQPPVAEFYRLMVIFPDKLKHLFRIVRKSIRSLRLLPQPLLQDAIVNWIGRDGEPPSARSYSIGNESSDCHGFSENHKPVRHFDNGFLPKRCSRSSRLRLISSCSSGR